MPLKGGPKLNRTNTSQDATKQKNLDSFLKQIEKSFFNETKEINEEIKKDLQNLQISIASSLGLDPSSSDIMRKEYIDTVKGVVDGLKILGKGVSMDTVEGIAVFHIGSGLKIETLKRKLEPLEEYYDLEETDGVVSVVEGYEGGVKMIFALDKFSENKKLDESETLSDEKVIVPGAKEDIKLQETQKFLNSIQSTLNIPIKIGKKTLVNFKENVLYLTLDNIKAFSYRMTATVSMLLMSMKGQAQSTVISSGTAIDKIIVGLVLLGVGSVVTYKLVKNYLNNKSQFTLDEKQTLKKLKDLEKAKESGDPGKIEEVIDEIQQGTMGELPTSMIGGKEVDDINQTELEKSLLIKKEVDALINEGVSKTDMIMDKTMGSTLDSVDSYKKEAKTIFDGNIHNFKKKIHQLKKQRAENKESKNQYLHKQLDIEIQKLQYMIDYNTGLQKTVSIVSQNVKNSIINGTPLKELSGKEKTVKELSNLKKDLNTLLDKQNQIDHESFVKELQEIDKKIKDKKDQARNEGVVLQTPENTALINGKTLEILDEGNCIGPGKISFKINNELKEIIVPSGVEAQVWVSNPKKVKINISHEGKLLTDELYFSGNDLSLMSSGILLEEKLSSYKNDTVIYGKIDGGIDINSSNLQFEDLVFEKNAGGTQGCKIYKHKKTGERFYVKEYAGNSDRCATEYICNKIYNSMSVLAIDTQLLSDKSGKIHAVSKEISGIPFNILDKSDKSGLKNTFNHADIKKGFVIDAWLANRDVFGLNYDNILKTNIGFAKSDLGGVDIGKPTSSLVRIDAGGGLFYRGMGAHKPSFGNSEVTEINTMRDPSQAKEAGVIFEDITDAEIKQQVKQLASIMTDAEIEKIVTSSGISNAGEVINALIGRRNRLKNTYLNESSSKILNETEVVEVSPENKIVFGNISSKFNKVQESINNGTYNLFGEKVIFDDDVIQDHHLVIHKEIFDGKNKTAIRFKLTEHYWKDVLSTLKKKKDVSKSSISYKYTGSAGQVVNYPIPMIRFNVTVGGKQVPVLIASNSASQRAMWGEVKILLDDNNTFGVNETELLMQKVASKLGILSAFKNETEVSIKKLQDEKLEIRNNPKLGSMKEKIGSERDISQEYKTYTVDEKALNNLKSKGLHSVIVSVTGGSDSVLSIIKSGYFLSTFNRFNKGIITNKSTMSPSSDFDNGGANSVYMRMQTKKTLKNRGGGGSVNFVFNPRLAARADVYCYTTDKFGSKMKNVFDQRVSPSYLIDYLDGKNSPSVGSNEMMFGNKVGLEYLEQIVCTDKKGMISHFKENGIFEINGKKIEDIIITSDEYKKRTFN